MEEHMGSRKVYDVARKQIKSKLKYPMPYVTQKNTHTQMK